MHGPAHTGGAPTALATSLPVGGARAQMATTDTHLTLRLGVLQSPHVTGGRRLQRGLEEGEANEWRRGVIKPSFHVGADRRLAFTEHRRALPRGTSSAKKRVASRADSASSGHKARAQRRELNTRPEVDADVYSNTGALTLWEVKLVEQFEFVSHVSMVHPTCTQKSLRAEPSQT